MINKKFLKLITCAIVSICVYENNTYSMDKIYGDNSIEQISNNNQETMLNTEVNNEYYSNTKFTKTLDKIFKSEEWFNFKPKKEWPGQYTQEEKDRYAKHVDCKNIEEYYEKELVESYNKISERYSNNYLDSKIAWDEYWKNNYENSEDQCIDSDKKYNSFKRYI